MFSDSLIVDYGMGNIRSLAAALEHVGAKVKVSSDPLDISRSRNILLPGVGSFSAAMRAISAKRLAEPIKDAASSGEAKILGICLGMQILLDSSEEGSDASGLGLVSGTLERFETSWKLPIPHIGFNSVRFTSDLVLFRGLPNNTDFYFVHSFRALSLSPDVKVASCIYGSSFIASFEAGNVYGTQFHPEKSQTNGLKVLANFISAEPQ